MEIQILQDFSGGVNTEVSPDLLDIKSSPDSRNFLFDETTGNLVGRKGFSIISRELQAQKLTNFIELRRSDGSVAYVISGVRQGYHSIWVSSTPYFTVAGGGTNLLRAGGEVLRLDPAVVPYFCILEDNLYIFNGVNDVYRWDGNIETNEAVLMEHIPSGRGATVHHSRMFVWGLRGDPSACVFSEIIDSMGNIISVEDESAWLEINKRWCHRNDGDVITAGKSFMQQLYVFKNHKIFRLVGTTPETYQYQLWTDVAGCPFYKSLAEVGNMLYWAGQDGIYRTNGESYEKLTDRIETYYKDTITATQFISQLNFATNEEWNAGVRSENIRVVANALANKAITNIDLTDDGKLVDNTLVIKPTLSGSFLKSGFVPNYETPSARYVIPAFGDNIYSESGGDDTREFGWHAVSNLNPYTVAKNEINFGDNKPFITSFKLRVSYTLIVRTVPGDLVPESEKTKMKTRIIFYGLDGNEILTKTFENNQNLTFAVNKRVSRVTVLSYVDLTQLASGLYLVKGLIRWRNVNANGYYIQSGKSYTLGEKELPTLQEPKFFDLLGRHIKTNDIGYKFAHFWNHNTEETTDITCGTDKGEVVDGKLSLKTTTTPYQKLTVSPGFSEIYSPAFWISPVRYNDKDAYGSVKIISQGDCIVKFRAGTTANAVNSAEWIEIFSGDSLNTIIRENYPQDGIDYRFFQLGVVLLDKNSKVEEISVPLLENVGDGMPGEYHGNPFALNWEGRYLLLLPHKSPVNNSAIILDKNNAITLFDGQNINAIIKVGRDKYYGITSSVDVPAVLEYDVGATDGGHRINYYWHSSYLKVAPALLDKRLHEARVLYQSLKETTTGYKYPYDEDHFVTPPLQKSWNITFGKNEPLIEDGYCKFTPEIHTAGGYSRIARKDWVDFEAGYPTVYENSFVIKTVDMSKASRLGMGWSVENNVGGTSYFCDLSLRFRLNEGIIELAHRNRLTGAGTHTCKPLVSGWNFDIDDVIDVKMIHNNLTGETTVKITHNGIVIYEGTNITRTDYGKMYAMAGSYEGGEDLRIWWDYILWGYDREPKEISIDDSSMRIDFIFRYDNDYSFEKRTIPINYSSRIGSHKIPISSSNYGKFIQVGVQSDTKNRRPIIQAMELIVDNTLEGY